jgi:hypothetical protein
MPEAPIGEHPYLSIWAISIEGPDTDITKIAYPHEKLEELIIGFLPDHRGSALV